MNYWKDASEVIECFKNIGNKQTHEFITFDIKDFNPAIMKDLKMVKVSWRKVQISDDNKKIIYPAESLHYLMKEICEKKRWFVWRNSGGVWWCRYIWTCWGTLWTFLLNKISEKYDKNSISLYRNNRLSAFKNKSGTQLERIKKSLQKTFKFRNSENLN